MYVCARLCVRVHVCGTHYAPRPRNYVRADGPETQPSLLINDPRASSTTTTTTTLTARLFFYAVVSPRHRFSRRVDRFPFRSAARTLISLLGPLRYRKAPWRMRGKGKTSRENPHSKKKLTRLMQSGGQSLFIHGTSLNISSVFENAARLFIVYPRVNPDFSGSRRWGLRNFCAESSALLPFPSPPPSLSVSPWNKTPSSYLSFSIFVLQSIIFARLLNNFVVQ